MADDLAWTAPTAAVDDLPAARVASQPVRVSDATGTLASTRYGDIKPGVLPLRPLAAGEILDGAVAAIRHSPRAAIGLAVPITLVFSLLSILFGRLDLGRIQPDSVTTGAELGQALDTLVTFIGGLMVAGVLSPLVGNAVLGQPTSLGQAWHAVRRRIGGLLGVSALVALLSVLPAVPILAFGIASAGLFTLAAYAMFGIYVTLSLSTAAVVMEQRSIVAAVRRSWTLVRRSWWRVLGVSLLAAVVGAVIQLAVLVPLALVDNGINLASVVSFTATSGQGWAHIAGRILGQLLTAPFTGCVLAILYVDRRMRSEALDVTLAAHLRRAA